GLRKRRVAEGRGAMVRTAVINGAEIEDRRVQQGAAKRGGVHHARTVVTPREALRAGAARELPSLAGFDVNQVETEFNGIDAAHLKCDRSTVGRPSGRSIDSVGGQARHRRST